MVQRREFAILSLLLALSILLWFIHSYLVTNLDIETPTYLQIEQNLVSIKKENMRLSDEILYSRSYNHIASVATSEGYRPAKFITLSP